MEEIPHRPNLPLDSLVGSDDLDAVMSVVANLATEVIELQERVVAIEGSGDSAALQERIDAFIARVYSPLGRSG